MNSLLRFKCASYRYLLIIILRCSAYIQTKVGICSCPPSLPNFTQSRGFMWVYRQHRRQIFHDPSVLTHLEKIIPINIIYLMNFASLSSLKSAITRISLPKASIHPKVGAYVMGGFVTFTGGWCPFKNVFRRRWD